MDLRYVLKENCPRCGKKTRFGIRFCPFCGQYTGNDGPRFRLRAAQEIHEMYAGQNAGADILSPGKEKAPSKMVSAAEGIAKAAAPIGSIFGKARTAVFDVMEQGEAAADPEIQPFFFHIRDTLNAAIRKDFCSTGKSRQRGKNIISGTGILCHSRTEPAAGSRRSMPTVS